MKHVVVNSASSKVVNIIELDKGRWTPPEGCYVVKSEEAEIGDIYDKDKDIFYTNHKTTKNVDSPRCVYKNDKEIT